MMELIAQNMAPIMFVSLIGFLLIGYPVAFALGASALATSGAATAVVAPAAQAAEVGQVRLGQRQQRVERTADLEGPGELQGLGLDEHRCAAELVEHRGGEQGSAAHPALESLGGRPDRLDPEVHGVTIPSRRLLRKLLRERGVAGRGVAERGEDLAGLGTDVGRAGGVPVEEALGDLVQRLRGGEVRPLRRGGEDRPRHGRVVGPLAGREVAEAAADHLGLRFVQGRAELVGDAEGVATRLADEHSRRAVALDLKRPEAVEAVRGADAVILGPGSWFTSVLTHLLVPELRRALAETNAAVLNGYKEQGGMKTVVTACSAPQTTISSTMQRRTMSPAVVPTPRKAIAISE